MGGIKLKQFLLTFLGSFSGIITAFILLIKLKINKERGKKWEIPSVTKCGPGMMQGLCSKALNFIYKSSFGEYYVTNFYKNWEELYDSSSVKIDSNGFHNYYDPCFYDLLVCVVNLNDPYEFISFINYNTNPDTIQKFFDNLIYSIEEKKKLLKDIKVQASFEVEEILDRIKLNDTNCPIENENNKKQSEGFYL